MKLPFGQRGSRGVLASIASVVMFVACAGHEGGVESDVVVARQALIDPSTILVDTGTDVGATSGQFSVGFDGSANYLVPLWTPESISPATQPMLSLRYASSAGEGLVGYGWDVTGFSRITRCPKGDRLGEIVRPVQFHNDDALCMDGLRLVYIESESGGAARGTSGAVYHTEPDQLARITVTGHDALGPLTFEVRTADGRIHTFGSPIEGMKQTFTAPPHNPTAPVFTSFTRARLSWVLKRTDDRFGNVMLISWDQQPVQDGFAAEALPVQIDYGGGPQDVLRRQVHFHYAIRPAETMRVAWTSGLPQQRSMRLTAIEMRAPNPTATDTVRWYELGYGSVSVTQRQLLRSLQECDGPPNRAGRACKQPTTFSYEGGLDTFQKVTTSINDIRLSTAGYDKFWRLMVADLNGDGRDDVLYRNGRDWKYSLSRCAADLTGCGYSAGTTLNIASTLRGGSSAQPFDPVIVDMDLDGIPDLAGIDPNTPNRYLFFRGAVGANGTSVSFTLDRTEPAGAEATAGLWIMSPTGKFKPEIFRPLSSGLWGQWFPDFQSYSPLIVAGDAEVQWKDTDPVRSWNSYFEDIDGDGSPDLLGNVELPGLSGVKRLVVASHGFDATGVTTLPISEPDGVARKYMFGDFNGDGLPDAMQFASGMSGPRLAENSGDGFREAVLRALPADANVRMGADAQWTHLSDPGVRVMDYDGDGRDDLLLVDDGRVRSGDTSAATRSRMKVLLSRNGGFVEEDVPSTSVSGERGRHADFGRRQQLAPEPDHGHERRRLEGDRRGPCRGAGGVGAQRKAQGHADGHPRRHGIQAGDRLRADVEAHRAHADAEAAMCAAARLPVERQVDGGIVTWSTTATAAAGTGPATATRGSRSTARRSRRSGSRRSSSSGRATSGGGRT